MFDITVDTPHHSFLAEGVLVHKKSEIRSCELEGERVFQGDACVCADGGDGSVDCDPSGGSGACTGCASVEDASVDAAP